MSFEKFDDNCPGCRPAIIDPETGKVLSDDHPAMAKVRVIWADLTQEERECFHRFMCQNSRDERDVAVVNGIVEKMTESS